MPAWLPSIVTLTSYGGNHQLYLDDLYQIYLRDFVNVRSTFCGMPIITDDRVIDASQRDEAFIHLTTCDDLATGGRFFEPRRTERIPWIKPTIDNYADAQNVKVWEVRKKGKQKVNILIESERYHIVLTRYKTVFNLTTAYYVNYDNALQTLIREHSNSPTFTC